MTRSDRGRAVLADLPLDRLLTETDGPFTQVDGRRAEPADVRVTSAIIAHVRNLPVDGVAIAVQTNLQTLLRLNVDTRAR
jgi:TatD DNase family protein